MLVDGGERGGRGSVRGYVSMSARPEVQMAVDMGTSGHLADTIEGHIGEAERCEFAGMFG